jgi:hypothetical protein
VVVFSLPLALPFMLPQLDNSPTLAEIVLKSVVVGLNAMAWGYGLAALWRKIARWGKMWKSRSR